MLLSSVQAVWAVACANHSLQSYFFQREFFGELIVPAPQYGFYNRFECYLKRLE